MSEDFKDNTDKENPAKDTKRISDLETPEEITDQDTEKEGIEKEEGEKEGEEGEEGEERKEEKKFLSLYQRVQIMSVPEKIQLALKGDKEARSLLIRDPNKLVSTAVIKSPKISESEIQQIVQSRSVTDEILRIIVQNREWMSKYKIKVGLVNNPLTPLTISLNILNNLRERDLRLLSKNRNVPAALSRTAKKLWDERSKHQ
ncbi:MAG: hypothetical protein AB1401_00100 [Thermodesulfobacteriota bacterium]